MGRTTSIGSCRWAAAERPLLAVALVAHLFVPLRPAFVRRREPARRTKHRRRLDRGHPRARRLLEGRLSDLPACRLIFKVDPTGRVILPAAGALARSRALGLGA